MKKMKKGAAMKKGKAMAADSTPEGKVAALKKTYPKRVSRMPAKSAA